MNDSFIGRHRMGGELSTPAPSYSLADFFAAEQRLMVAYLCAIMTASTWDKAAAQITKLASLSELDENWLQHLKKRLESKNNSSANITLKQIQEDFNNDHGWLANQMLGTTIPPWLPTQICPLEVFATLRNAVACSVTPTPPAPTPKS